MGQIKICSWGDRLPVLEVFHIFSEIELRKVLF